MSVFLSSRLRCALATFALVGAGMLATSTQAHAQLLFNDNFDQESGGLNYTNFANWNVLRGDVDAIDFGYTNTADGLPANISVDMDGSGSGAGLLVTKTAFDLTPGTYNLNFDLGKNGADLESMVVSVGNAFSQQISDGDAYPNFVNQSFTFTVGMATTGAISFDHAGADFQGYVIDNVALTRVSGAAAAPEPATLPLVLALAVPVLGLALRRRKHV